VMTDDTGNQWHAISGVPRRGRGGPVPKLTQKLCECYQTIFIKIWLWHMRHLAKFRQNRPHGFGDIAIFDFQDGVRLPSYIFKFLVDRLIGMANMHQNAIFCKIGQTVARRRLTVFKTSSAMAEGLCDALVSIELEYLAVYGRASMSS